MATVRVFVSFEYNKDKELHGSFSDRVRTTLAMLFGITPFKRHIIQPKIGWKKPRTRFANLTS